MTELGGGIDELEVDISLLAIKGRGKEGLSEDEGSLSDTDGAALDHDVVIEDITVVGESTDGSDVLKSDIGFSGGVVIGFSGGLAESVDSLVELSSVVVSVLTGSGDSPSDSFGMPRSDATDLSETLVSLSGQLSDSVSGDDSLVTVTLGDTDDISEVSSGEHVVNSDFLLEVGEGPVDFLVDGSSVDLDFQQGGLDLADVGDVLHLGVGQDSDDGGSSLDEGDGLVDVLSPVLGGLVLLESSVVVLASVSLVESSDDRLVQVLGEDGLDLLETSRGVDVSDDSDDHHLGHFDDGHGFHDFLLVKSGSRLLDFSDDVGHAGFESDKCGKMDGLGGIILGELADYIVTWLINLLFPLCFFVLFLGRNPREPHLGCSNFL